MRALRQIRALVLTEQFLKTPAPREDTSRYFEPGARGQMPGTSDTSVPGSPSGSSVRY